MKRIDIVWFIEHISRELDVAASVSILLNKKYKKTIKVAPLNSLDIFKNYNPSIVLLPYCYSIKDAILRNCFKYWPEAVFVNLSWEQIFYQANLEYKAPRDIFAKKFVIHHAWSSKRKNFLMERGVAQKNIFVNGHPAYRLYKKPYRNIFAAKKELAKRFKLNWQKKWLFFPENYSWFFYSDHNIKEIIRQGQSEKVVLTMKRYCGEALSQVFHWLNDAVQKYGREFEFILRPRPAFSLDYFKKKVQFLFPRLSEKIRVIKDYSVREWILSSDIVISSFSTSLIEAAVAGKSVYMLDPIPFPQELKASWYELVLKIKSKKSFFDILEKSTPDESFTKLADWAKKEFFLTPDPIIGLVDYLGKFDLSRRNLNSSELEKIKSGSLISKYDLKQKIISAFGRIKRNLIDDKTYFRNDDRDKYEIEINQRLEDFKSLFKI